MGKQLKTICINPELQEYCQKENINASELFEKALLKEKERRAGQITITMDLNTAESYCNAYTILKGSITKQVNHYEKIRDSLLELEHNKQEQTRMNEQKEAKVRALHAQAFEDFKADFNKALVELKGKPYKDIAVFVRSNCPAEYVTYFLKEGRALSKEILEVKK